MTILALEFSSDQRSVAVLRGDVAAEAIETGGRNTAAFGMIEKVLAEAKLEREQIDTIAVGLGPGSYTGIRSAIAIAQGWQLARAVRLIGISSMEAMAAQAQAEKIYGKVDVVVDAQRGEIYHARYEISPATVHEAGPLRIVSPSGVESSRGDDGMTQRSLPTVIGPQATRWFVSGKIIFPRALTLARMAAGRSEFVAGPELTPIYLRETGFVKAPPSRVIV